MKKGEKIMNQKKPIFEEPALRLVSLVPTDILSTSSDTEMTEVEDEDE